MKTQTPASRPPCRHCTVPVDDGGDTCDFCSSYVPPESASQQLDIVVNRIDILRHDLNEVLNSLPADAPLFGCADLVVSICHLKRASEMVGRAAAQLEADAEVVQR